LVAAWNKKVLLRKSEKNTVISLFAEQPHLLYKYQACANFNLSFGTKQDRKRLGQSIISACGSHIGRSSTTFSDQLTTCLRDLERHFKTEHTVDVSTS
jgi:hypothetical protein